ncbi:hypothetical protein DY000_02016338 [Brassica cretica]|uniref:Uncharacterized protein n=1 Tax=Brassica cretica TaxID=69181 RepID=A0ABQ7D7R6_BRACR|nr:hypothetical protein DY000_02016338 [Brassica cretica]
MDQYMEPALEGDQDDQIIPTEVRSSDRTRQTDRTVYRIDPRLSGNELWLEPQSDDRIDRTTDRLSRPSRQSKTDSRARLSLGNEEFKDDHAFSLFGHLVLSGDRVLDLASVFDSLMDFTHPNFSKARIIHLSEDLAHVWTRIIREEHPAVRTDHPEFVHLLTAVHTSSPDEPGQ